MLGTLGIFHILRMEGNLIRSLKRESHYLNPSQGLPTTFPFPSNLTPSSLNNFLFLSSFNPSFPFLPQDPINPPNPPPLASTRWQGTSGASGLFLNAFP